MPLPYFHSVLYPIASFHSYSLQVRKDIFSQFILIIYFYGATGTSCHWLPFETDGVLRKTLSWSDDTEHTPSFTEGEQAQL